MGCKHESFPALAFLDLAVAQKGKDVHAGFLHLGGQRHAAGGGNALAQAAGGHIHAGHRVHVGVTFQIAAVMAQGGQVTHREKSAFCQSGIQSGGAVALGQNKPIPQGVLRVFGVDVHNLDIQIGQHIGGRQTSAGMSAFCAVRRFNDSHPHAGRSHFQLQRFSFCHNASSR